MAKLANATDLKFIALTGFDKPDKRQVSNLSFFIRENQMLYAFKDDIVEAWQSNPITVMPAWIMDLVHKRQILYLAPDQHYQDWTILFRLPDGCYIQMYTQDWVVKNGEKVYRVAAQAFAARYVSIPGTSKDS